ncbi:MAG: TRAM domain-containing protein [Actinobacteria bacterium]|nr:TRAM domain-containing protein [Actinomycetota bacterium]MCA1719725.1 TRAM domain-containing protein [Actinomycetota bacterium]
MILTLGAVAAGGACVARAEDGRVVFVRHGIPGETVRVVVTGESKSFLRADAVEALEASPDRVSPPCVYAAPGRCGGCDFQHVALPRQRLLKASLVEEQLRRLAGLDLPVVVEPVPGDVDGLRWRTRVSFGVRADGRAGLHKHRSRELEPVDFCLIATSDVEAVGAERLSWPGAASVEVVASGSQRVVDVSGRIQDLPDVEAGLVVNGRPRRVPHGVRHSVLGRAFDVAAGGFWQVHPGAASVLAAAVLDGLDPRPEDTVVDLYAGVGLFASLLADRVASVLAVEGDARACADAARNTYDQPNVRIRTAAVDAALVSRLRRPSLVVLDPPRAGAGLEVSRALVALTPRRIAYVACDPASFARDLRVFLDAGWTMPSLRAFDLFPMTEHVELVAVLEPPA